MGEKQRPNLTEAELRIMRVLWKRREASVNGVLEAIETPRLARNTVQTMLGILERKGYVRHRTDGRAFVYRAAVSEDAVQHAVLNDTVSRFFGGSAERLVMRLVDPERISKKDVDRIRQLLGGEGAKE